MRGELVQGVHDESVILGNSKFYVVLTSPHPPRHHFNYHILTATAGNGRVIKVRIQVESRVGRDGSPASAPLPAYGLLLQLMNTATST